MHRNVGVVGRIVESTTLHNPNEEGLKKLSVTGGKSISFEHWSGKAG